MAPKTHFDETRFRTLLDRWNNHQSLRRSGAPVAKLARSRADLDAARHSLPPVSLNRTA